MGTKNSTHREKHLKDLIAAIPYSILEKSTFIMLVIFILFPSLRAIIMLTGTRMSLDGYHRFLWYDHNRYVLLFGSIILIIYMIKLKNDNLLKPFITKLKSHPPIMFFLVFSFLMIISTVFSGLNSIKITGVPYRGEGLIGCLSYIMYFLLTLLFIKEKYGHLLLIFFATTATLNFTISMYDYIILDKSFSFSQFFTLFYNSNHYGYYILMVAILFCMFFLVSQKILHKIINLCLFMFSIIILLFNNTFGCQVALIIGIIFICIVYSIAKGKFMPLTLIIVTAFFLSYLISYNTSDELKDNITANLSQFSNDVKAISGQEHKNSTGVARLFLWELTINHISEKPLLGHGADGADQRLEIESNHISGRCHCEYLHYAVCFGIPAAVIYVIAIFSIYLRGLRFKDKLSNTNIIGLCVAFSYLVSAAFGNSMFYTTPYLFIMLGLGYYRDSENKIN